MDDWSALFTRDCSEAIHLQDFPCGIHGWGTVSMRYVPSTAFILQVRSLLKGEKSLPKYDRRREGAIKEYEEIVRKMRTVHSEYVTVCLPTRALDSTSTPNTMSRNEGSQSQNLYSS